MKSPLLCIALIICGAFAPASLNAEHTRIWRQADYSSFAKGSAHGVALTNDGKLAPAPMLTTFADPNMAFVWAMTEDASGNVYVAGGSNAKVLMLNRQGVSTVVFESQELSAQALATDKAGNLYVGTSPDGKVYRVSKEGKSQVLFDPKAKYIWNLLVSPDGTLFVSTGNKGEVFAVAPDGKAALFYQSPQRNIRAMAFDAGGNLLIGTEPTGTIARIQIKHSPAGRLPTAGPVFVVLEAAAKEITSLFTAPNGIVYATAVGSVTDSPLSPNPMQNAKSLEPGNTGGSILYRILPNDSAEEVWSSHDDIVYAGGLAADGKVLLGVGNRGLLLRIEDQNSFETIATTNTGQVTGMIARSDGKVLLCTANPGKIFKLASEVEGEGWFESVTFDAKVPARWGRLTWSLENGNNQTADQVSFFVRCGNTSNPEDNWMPWQGPYRNGANAQCPVSRFAQWRAVFSSAGAGNPRVTGVSLAYLPKNIRPVMDEVVLQSPGVEVQGTSWSTSGEGARPATLRRPGGGQTSALFSTPAPAAMDNLQGTMHKGFQSVLWNAHDDNGDDLTFFVYYQREGETQWSLLKNGITQKFYSWETRGMVDGNYRLKIVASDELSNPASDALQAERISETFKVDNTPPSVSDVHISRAENGLHLLFQAVDARSIISRAEFSIDSEQGWKVAFPVGLLSDANTEAYDVTLDSVAPGEHKVKVRIYDEFENMATATTNVIVSNGGALVTAAPGTSKGLQPSHQETNR